MFVRLGYAGGPIDTLSVPTPSTPHSIPSPRDSAATPAGVLGRAIPAKRAHQFRRPARIGAEGPNPPFTVEKEAGYAGAGHRVAPYADPMGLQPALPAIFAVEISMIAIKPEQIH
jgi:hypothetical protein